MVLGDGLLSVRGVDVFLRGGKREREQRRAKAREKSVSACRDAGREGSWTGAEAAAHREPRSQRVASSRPSPRTSRKRKTYHKAEATLEHTSAGTNLAKAVLEIGERCAARGEAGEVRARRAGQASEGERTCLAGCRRRSCERGSRP